MARIFKKITEEQYLSIGDMGVKVAFDWAGAGWNYYSKETLLDQDECSWIYSKEDYLAIKGMDNKHFVFYAVVDSEDVDNESN